MRVKVLRPFIDRITKTVYAKGNEIDVTEERYEELSSAALAPFVEIAEQKKTVASKKSTTKKNKK